MKRSRKIIFLFLFFLPDGMPSESADEEACTAVVQFITV